MQNQVLIFDTFSIWVNCITILCMFQSGWKKKKNILQEHSYWWAWQSSVLRDSKIKYLLIPYNFDQGWGQVWVFEVISRLLCSLWYDFLALCEDHGPLRAH